MLAGTSNRSQSTGDNGAYLRGFWVSHERRRAELANFVATPNAGSGHRFQLLSHGCGGARLLGLNGGFLDPPLSDPASSVSLGTGTPRMRFKEVANIALEHIDRLTDPSANLLALNKP